MDATYEITAMDNGQVRMAELNLGAFDECEGVEYPESSVVYPGGSDTESSVHVDNTGSSVQDTHGQVSTENIDVIVFYTAEARDEAGSIAAVKATAQAGVDVMNVSLTNSQTDIHVNLVYSGLLDHDFVDDSELTIDWFSDNETAINVRNSYGADMVAVLTKNGGCGRAYIMNIPGAGFEFLAFQRTRLDCAVGNLSLAHEFGHIMGLLHNPENAGVDPADASYPWSYGYYNVDAQFRSLMSYNAPCDYNCLRVQHFSNPDVNYNGFTTGVADMQDNARTLRLTAPIVNGFRDHLDDLIFADGFDK